MPIDVSSVVKVGNSLCLVLTRKCLQDLSLKRGDKVVLRVAGTKLIAERVPLETLANIGIPKPEPAEG